VPERSSSDLGRAVQDVAEKAQLLVREEIELAKAEMSAKVSKLVRGAIIGAVAGIFALAGLIYLLHGLSWLTWFVIDGDGNDVYLGYLIVALVLFLLGGLAGFLALRAIKKGTPPSPQMAIEEAQLIRQTLTSPNPTMASAPDRAAGSPAAAAREVRR
jgi:uncharacterized membrane protein YqjE